MNKGLRIATVATIIVLIVLGALWALSEKEKGTNDSHMATTTGEIPVGVMYVKDNLLLGKDGPVNNRYLIGFSGRPVYTYDNDTVGGSNCAGICTKTWPPYIIAASDLASLANLQSGVTGKTGTITRTDGSLQVTYDGKPLYFYAPDTDTSGASGDGISGVWHEVNISTSTSVAK